MPSDGSDCPCVHLATGGGWAKEEEGDDRRRLTHFPCASADGGCIPAPDGSTPSGLLTHRGLGAP